MVESDFGLIPKGWTVTRINEIANVVMGQSPKGTSYNENGMGMIFYQGRTDFGDRFPIKRLYTTEPKKIAKNGDLLMSVRAPVGDINIANEDCCIGRGLCALRSKDGNNSYLFYLFKNLKTQLDIYNGEGTVFGSINKNALVNLSVLQSNQSLINKYNGVISKLDKQYLVNAKENYRLAKIRDTLLPRLMSGEIRVPMEVAEQKN
ncbi:restriction endonuclease subunit S [Sporolactobacillus terrae]|nr:restriction endonuclease subunit S [Sporolactobacillus terrae]